MTKWLNKNRKATILGYFAAIFNAAMVIDWDNLDWSLVSTWVKVLGALLGPILMGHTSELKVKQNA